MDIMVLKVKSIIITLLFLFVAYTPAHATIYFYFDAEDGTVGNILPNPPICSLPCSGSKVESDGTYQSSGGAPQGAKYFQWTTYDTQPNAYTEIHPAPPFPINNVIGKTFYLAYFFNFTRINALDIWHTAGQSADKGVEIVGDGIRWLISRGAWSTLASNQDHHYTVWTGNPTYHLNLALEHGDIYWPNQNGYSNTNTLQLEYEHWYAAVMVLKIAADTTGSIAFYIDGIKISEYNNIITAANNSPTITDIKMGGSIAQPAYDAPAHYRKFDAMMLTDNWQDIVNGGYLSSNTPPPSDGGNTPPPSSGSGGDSGGGSGGGGCGFVKDSNGKGQGAKGEGLSFMLLIITLTIIYLIRRGKAMSRPIKSLLLISFINLIFSLIFALPAMAVEAICPGGTSPDSNVLMCDDFEDGTWLDNWSASAGYSPEYSEAVKCDSNNFGYQDKCAAYSGILHFDNAWGYDNHFAGRGLPAEYDELYLRMYIYFSSPYSWGNTDDKGIYFANYDKAIENIKIEYSSWGTGKPTLASYALSNERRYQNQGNDIIFQSGKWYLVEFYVKLNTPGVSDGIAKVWIDDASNTVNSQTLRIYYNNLLIRNSSRGYNRLMLTLYNQRCDLGSACPSTNPQWMKWDNIVVSKTPIGPMGGGGGGGNTPPLSSGSGGDSGGGSGSGSGCGFVKDINGKGQGAKGEGLSIMIILVLALTVIALFRKIKYFKGLLFLIMFLFPFSIANAATYYVDQNNATASDSNTGTETLPWKTLTKAANTVAAGDTVIVKAGKYVDLNGNMDAGWFNPANSGTASAPITYKSEPRLAAILAPKATGVDPAMDIFKRSYIIIDGFKAEGMILIMSSDHITVQNCEVIYGSTIYQDPSLNWGIALEGASYNTVRNNYVHNMLNSGNTQHNTGGIMVFGGSGSAFSNYNIIENNLVDAGGGTVYSAYGQKAGNITYNIWRNNIARNATTGFLGMGSTDVTRYSDYNEFYNNIIYDTKYAFELDHNSRWFKVHNNTAYNCTQFFSSASYPIELNNIGEQVWNNIIANCTSGYYWPNSNTSTSNTPLTEVMSLLSSADYNDFFNTPNIATWNWGNTSYTTLADWQNATSFDKNSLISDPLFVDVVNRDFHLQTNSPVKGKGLGGVNMGAYATGNEVIGPTDGGTGGDGGNTPPPPSSSSGGDSSASGGSGCGFIKDDGKGQGAKGEGGTMMILLVLALTAIVSLRKIKYFKGLLFLIMFLFPFSIANAADYYVATNGNDANPGTLTQPWKTVQKAANTLVAGDTAYIRGGTYNEYNIKFANSGALGNPITIKRYPGETAIIDGGFTSGSGLSWGAVIFIDNNHYITLDGLTIKRGLRANVRIGYDYNPTNIIIKNCDLSDFVASDNSGEITIVHGGNIVIENNLLHGYQPYTGDTSNSNNAAGVHIFYAGDLTIKNNTIYNTQRGIYYKGSWDNGSTTIIENNLIYNQNGWAGIMSAKRDTIIRNNIIRDVPFGHGILVFEESSSCNDLVSSDNKIIHNTIVDVYRGIDLDRSTSCQGAVNTIVKDNLIYNFISSGLRGLSIWPYYSVDNSNTTFDHNLIYSSSFSSPIRVLGNYYTTATAPLAGTGNIQQAPIFKDYANKDFTLMPNSPGYKAASDGYDMGADTSLPPTPTPDGGGGGGNTGGNTGNSGGDSSSSGGSGCGFIKDDGKGQKAKGEGVALIIMLIIALTGIALARRAKDLF